MHACMRVCMSSVCAFMFALAVGFGMQESCRLLRFGRGTWLIVHADESLPFVRLLSVQSPEG